MVLVEDAAESISSSDGEVIQSAGFGDRWREPATWGCALQGAVGPVIVVEPFEFTQGVDEVGLVQDECAVEQLGSAGSDPAFHDRVHPRDADPGRDRGDAAVGQYGVEGGGVSAVAVSDQVFHGGVGVL